MGWNRRTGGAWSKEEWMRYHINGLELLAASLTLQSFTKKLRQIHVKIFIDDNVAMSCINNMGTSRSPGLNSLTKEVWLWCMKTDIWLSAVRIPGKENIEADFEN